MLSTQIKELDITKLNRPSGRYVSCKLVGEHLYVSGQTTRINSEVAIHGRLGKELDVESGQIAAKLCATNIINQVYEACSGELSRIKSVIKLNIYLQTTECFTQHAAVADGASLYLLDRLGKRGVHSRTTVGVVSLPGGAAIEIDAIFELEAHYV